MRKILSIIVFLICSKNIYSSDTNKVTVTIYDPFNAKTTLTKEEIKIYKNAFKWNMGILPRGAFMLNYERSFVRFFTSEIGLGLTYRDYIFELVNYDDMGNYPTTNGSVKSSLGFAFDGAFRFYPKEGDFEGFYFSPIYRYRNYNLEIERSYSNITQSNDDNNTDYYNYNYNYNSENVFSKTTKWYNADYKASEMGFVVGWQYEGWWTEMLIDWYFGISYRNVSYNIHKEVYDKEFTYDVKRIDVIPVKKSYPALLCGVKIGFTL
jgi:hypothetical protein